MVSLVEAHGPKKWSTIAAALPGRIGKQCRERWHNHLNPDIRKDAWTQEEDHIILNAHATIGNKCTHTLHTLTSHQIIAGACTSHTAQPHNARAVALASFSCACLPSSGSSSSFSACCCALRS